MAGARWLTERIHLVGAGTGVTRLELFLDLVFVYAFLNVTGLTAADMSAEGLTRGLLLIALLWWCWAPYPWLGTFLRLDRGITPLLVFVLTATMFLVGVSLQEIPADRPAGLLGRLVFVVGYAVARLGPVLIMIGTRWRDAPLRRGLVNFLPFTGVAVLPLLAAGLLPEYLPPGPVVDWLQFGLVLLTIVIDYAGMSMVRAAHWEITSAAYWAERHALIILVAIGETIISIGVSQGLAVVFPVTWSMIGGIVLGVVIVGVLWSLYFDIARYAGEQAIDRVTGVERTLMGLQAYSVLHLPMIFGLILISFGLKVALADLGQGAAQLGARPVEVLYGGVAVYLLGLIGFEFRTDRRWGRSPLLGVALVIVLIPVAAGLPVLGAMAVLAGVVTALVLADYTVFRHRHRELHRRVRPTKREAGGVTPKELFFDLVFVYAFLQVSALMAADPGWRGLRRGMLVLIVLWWAWSCFAWLSNSVRSEAGPVRLVLMAVMVNTLVIAFVIPQAFFGTSGGLPGPVLFVWCYAAIRAFHIAGTWLLARGNPDLRRQVYRLMVPTGIALALLAVAASGWVPSADPRELHPVRVWLWVAAIAVDLGAGVLIGLRGWRIRSAEHWADRHALIILIALGEAIISMGLAVVDRRLSALLLVALLLGVALLSTLWWVYFRVDATAAERSVAEATGDRRTGMARDGYTYLHLPMVAGAVLVSFGLRETVDTVGLTGTDPAVADVAHLTLYGGTVCFLLAVQAFWWRTGGSVRSTRLIWTILLVALAPTTVGLPLLVALIVLTVTCLAFVAIEATLAQLNPPD
ncbi:low temperature requirement protein A [Micromonospora sp. CPCC 206060]|uniref:low temperature requirement protein A n=1 Tax=Micromonospora sp. CPCC 206060 TaxID=3122406 RepID=UPI002FF3A4B8